MIQPSSVANVDKAKRWGFDKFIYFLKESPFTQWSMIPFSNNGITYNCAEQWMMAKKAELFADFEILEKILQVKHPRDQKRLGREVKNFNKSKWNLYAQQIVFDGNLLKFQQNPDALEQLFETNGTMLVEVNPQDPVWGIGITKQQAEAGEQWQGTNWLGETLTNIRKKLID